MRKPASCRSPSRASAKHPRQVIRALQMHMIETRAAPGAQAAPAWLGSFHWRKAIQRARRRSLKFLNRAGCRRTPLASRPGSSQSEGRARPVRMHKSLQSCSSGCTPPCNKPPPSQGYVTFSPGGCELQRLHLRYYTGASARPQCVCECVCVFNVRASCQAARLAVDTFF